MQTFNLHVVDVGPLLQSLYAGQCKTQPENRTLDQPLLSCGGLKS
jgi:hypothetical protein